MFGLQVLVSLFLCTPTVSPTQHARPVINTNILAIVKQICLVRYYDQCKECVLCKGYRPEARSYVIYSPRALRPRATHEGNKLHNHELKPINGLFFTLARFPQMLCFVLLIFLSNMNEQMQSKLDT